MERGTVGWRPDVSGLDEDCSRPTFGIPTASHVASGRLFQLLSPHLPPLEDRNNNNTLLMALWRLDELIHMKDLQ